MRKVAFVLALLAFTALVLAQDNQNGKRIYRQGCSGCHGADGGGAVGPRLADNPHLSKAQYVIHRIIHGGGGMPPFGKTLSAEQIAAVTNYIRTSWGNIFSKITTAQVKKQKGGGQQSRGQGEVGGQSGGSKSGGDQSGGGQQSGDSRSGGSGEGATIFVQQGCASCHGGSGEGAAGPALAGDDKLKNAGFVIAQILYGGGPMPAFGGKLNSKQIADVATYIRISWGNSFGKVTQDQVEVARGGSSSDKSGGQ